MAPDDEPPDDGSGGADLPRAARLTVMIVGLAGAAAAGLAVVLGHRSGLGDLAGLGAVAAALALSMGSPLYVLRSEEAEDVAVDEAFVIVLVMLFPPLAAVTAFVAATLVVGVIHRRPLVKVMFNTGQMALATSAAVGVAALLGLGGAEDHTGPVAIVAALVGTVVFFVVNQAAMTAILVATGAATIRERLVETLGSNLLVSGASAALGLLIGVAAVAHEWTLVLGLVPLAVLRVVLARSVHAHEERERIDGLLHATAGIHRSVRLADVTDALAQHARDLLRCRYAEVRAQAPGTLEIGARLPGDETEWLVASGSRGLTGFTAEDQRLLDALAALGADAHQNARLVEEIHHRAFHDALTGLPNRVLFEERLSYVLQQTRRSPRPVAVLFVDLDRFKKVNDTLGHQAGNELIAGVAERLQVAVRPGDVVARNGGDEFTVMLAALRDESDAVLIAERILDAMNEPFRVAGQHVYISASIGIATHPPEECDAATMLKHADLAMYRAKERGRNTYQVFSARIRQSGSDRLQLEADLHAAIVGDGLALAYQPQIDLATGRMVGVEALVRWNHDTLGSVSPARFIPMAEETGLIRDVDRWVLDRALTQARQWMDMGLPPMKVAVNLSGHDVQEVRFVDRVAETLAAHRVPPQYLELEITESVAMRHSESGGVFHGLKDLGCRLAIDDFGTGYSMLSRLQDFPLDKLKIDKSFIDAITHPDGDAPIVAALISMAQGLGLEVCAEGVESAVQWTFLDRLRCDLVQGHYVSRPVEPERIVAMVGDRGVLHLP